MATALFLNRTDLIRNSNMDGNIDTDKILPFIKLSQELEINCFPSSISEIWAFDNTSIAPT